jgi:hypothetical protein
MSDTRDCLDIDFNAKNGKTFKTPSEATTIDEIKASDSNGVSLFFYAFLLMAFSPISFLAID